MINSSPVHRQRLNLYVDVAVAAIFLLVLAPSLTGLAIHEWLSTAAGAAIVVHLLLHWQWIGTTVKRVWSSLSLQTRVNAVLNVSLFIVVTVAIFSGLMISEVVLRTFGITTSQGSIWRSVHSLFANLALGLIGLHIAVHVRWIVYTTLQHVPLIANISRLKPAAVTTNEESPFVGDSQSRRGNP
ncbi:MAG: hypothetical protein NVS4B8_29650 [Herpetosiphon sp.]